MLTGMGGQLNIKISWIPCPVRVVQGAKVKKQIVSWPVVHFSGWVRTSLLHGGQLGVGNHVTNIQGWHQLFREFWRNYQRCDPLHPTFHEVDESQRHPCHLLIRGTKVEAETQPRCLSKVFAKTSATRGLNSPTSVVSLSEVCFFDLSA